MVDSKDLLKMPKIEMSDFDFRDALNKFWQILKLNKKVFSEVAGNEKYNAAALVFLMLGAVAEPLGLYLFGTRVWGVTIKSDFAGALVLALLGLVFVFFLLYIFSFIATKLFNGKGSFDQFFRIAGLASGIQVFEFFGYLLPALLGLSSVIISVWMVIVLYNALKHVFKLDGMNAVLTMVLGALAFAVMSVLLRGLGLEPAMRGGSMRWGGISITY